MGDPSIIGSLEITILTYAVRCKSTAWSLFATEKSAENNETVANHQTIAVVIYRPHQ